MYQKLLFLKEKELFTYCQEAGTPLPFSLSSLRKDRLDQRLGGMPYRRHGGTILYSPTELLKFISALPVVCGSSTLRSKKRTTKPTKIESVLASRAGLSVAEFRAKSMNEVKNG
ncbi:MAG: hypothetical protein WC216_10475 [Gallionella sp.]